MFLAVTSQADMGSRRGSGFEKSLLNYSPRFTNNLVVLRTGASSNV